LINAGDTVNAETWVRYENKLSYSRNTSIGAIAALLSGNFSFTSGFEGFTAPQTTTAFSNALTSAGFMGDGSDDERPFAYLNYILFDESMTLVDAGWQRVVDSAGFDVGEEALANRHERIAFEQPIYVPENGYIYVWVSNESEGTKVWFDDVKITHTQITVTQASDYGVWGDVLRELKAPEFTYRHGYQGSFSEKDKETGWNHFEAREYDPIIGRWLVRDPAKQHFSPYLAIGNNPINRIDPDGKWDFGEKIKNWFRFKEFITDAEFDQKYSQRVRVIIWETDKNIFGVDDVGHTALEIDGMVYGFYPTDIDGDGVYTKLDLSNSQGDLHANSLEDFNFIYKGQKITTFSVKVTPQQKWEALRDLKRIRVMPGIYKLSNNQCTTTIIDVLARARVNLSTGGGAIRDSGHFYTSPSQFMSILDAASNLRLIANKETFIVKP
jgi:RHS repeat-associated protein